jgi:hypothetical protein
MDSRRDAGGSFNAFEFRFIFWGITMKTIRYATLFGALSLAVATLITLGPAAFAQPAPLPDGGGQIPSGPPVAHPDPGPIVTHHGSPVWVFIVVAVAAIVVTLAAELVLAKARPALRRRVAHA